MQLQPEGRIAGSPVKRLRLAVCIGAFEYGGQGVVVEQELLHLRDEFDVTLLSETSTRPVVDGIGHVEVTPFKSFPRIDPAAVHQLRLFDLVHCHDSLGFMAAAVAANRPLVVTSHGIAPARVRNSMGSAAAGLVTELAYPYLYRRAHVLVAISEYVASWIRRRTHRRPVVIPNGISKVESGSAPVARRLLYVGEVSRRKGISDLLDGLESCSTEITLDVVGRVVGAIDPRMTSGPLAVRLRAHGVLSESELQRLYSTCFATTSASFWEGFGLPVLEGFGFGRPAIVRRQGGMAEQVDQSGAGLCFRSAAEIPGCIEAVAAKWNHFSDRATTYAARHRWSAVFQRYAHIFKALGS